MILRLHRKDQQLVHIDHLASKDRALAIARRKIETQRRTIVMQARAIDGLKADLSDARACMVNLRAMTAAGGGEAKR